MYSLQYLKLNYLVKTQDDIISSLSENFVMPDYTNNLCNNNLCNKLYSDVITWEEFYKKSGRLSPLYTVFLLGLILHNTQITYNQNDFK